MKPFRIGTAAILLVCASSAAFAAPPVFAKPRQTAWGKILIAGGNYGDTADLYDPVSSHFVPAHFVPQMRGRRRATATLLVTGPNAGKILIAGGDNKNDVARASTDLYDPATNTVMPGPKMHVPRSGQTAVAIAFGPNAGKILILGGDNPGKRGRSSTEFYDPATNTFSPGPMMGGECHFCTATPIASGKNAGKILIAGEYRHRGGLSMTELYDQMTNSFAPGPNTNMLLVYTATAIPSGKNEGKILLIGAVDVASGKYEALTELYDPANNKFEPGPTMKQVRDGHTATVITSGANAGKILIAGGEHRNNGARGGETSVASTEIYDPDTNSFTPGPTMNFPRVAHTAQVILSGPNAGKILIAGGIREDYDKDGRGVWAALTSTELYDPVTNKFAATRDTPQMNSPRYDAIAIQLFSAPSEHSQ